MFFGGFYVRTFNLGLRMEPMSSHVLATVSLKQLGIFSVFFNKSLMSTGVCDLFSLENVYKQPTEYF